MADAPSGFAVMALGRLGSREFDVLSDADVLFVADEAAPPDAARRAAERTMDSLTAYTRDGTVFPGGCPLAPAGPGRRTGDYAGTTCEVFRASTPSPGRRSAI